VKLEDTIRSFTSLADGEYDHIPEQCFYMCGAIEEVLENYEKMQAEG
jgi:F-type H+-transporting ATPase subunit beta